MSFTEAPIVIIEDDADDQEIIKSLCGEIGICGGLQFYSDGSEALDFLRTTTIKPFIILCDINMPKMNGLQLREEINRDENLRKKSIPFIFFSTAASPDQVTAAYDMTVQGFFVKENSFRETAKTLEIIFTYWRKCKQP